VKPVGIVGNLSRDLLPGEPPRPGGAPIYAARTLRALGRPGAIACKCSTADRPELLPKLAALGVPVRCIAGRATTTFSMEYDGDERQMAVDVVGDSWTPDEAIGWVARALDRVEWVHVAPLLRSDFPVETIERLARGRRLLLDGQGLVRVPETGPLRLDDDFDPDLLRSVAILKLAEEEARTLVGEELEPSALMALGVREVIVTLGSRGSLVVAGGQAERVSATPIRGGVADSTGAGDGFAIAYLVARSSGHSPSAAARRASTVVAELLSGRAR
jgi:sugar/nucleoside kinase (ribokinase family)